MLLEFRAKFTLLAPTMPHSKGLEKILFLGCPLFGVLNLFDNVPFSPH